MSTSSFSFDEGEDKGRKDDRRGKRKAGRTRPKREGGCLPLPVENKQPERKRITVYELNERKIDFGHIRLVLQKCAIES